MYGVYSYVKEIFFCVSWVLIFCQRAYKIGYVYAEVSTSPKNIHTWINEFSTIIHIGGKSFKIRENLSFPPKVFNCRFFVNFALTVSTRFSTYFQQRLSTYIVNKFFLFFQYLKAFQEFSNKSSPSTTTATTT